jgi:hypothetical protein
MNAVFFRQTLAVLKEVAPRVGDRFYGCLVDNQHVHLLLWSDSHWPAGRHEHETPARKIDLIKRTLKRCPANCMIVLVDDGQARPPNTTAVPTPIS